MLKSYSHDNLRKGRYVKATKRPFFSLLGSRGQALSVSDPSWAWTDADNLEPSGYAGKAIGADGLASVAARLQVVGIGPGPAGVRHTESLAPAAKQGKEGTLCGLHIASLPQIIV